MQALWSPIASCIEFFGTIMILAHIIGAAWLLLHRSSLGIIKSVVAAGAIAGLDFKMAATLLKALSLSDWPHIGKFAAILLLRAILKRSFAIESNNNKVALSNDKSLL